MAKQLAVEVDVKKTWKTSTEEYTEQTPLFVLR